MERRKAHGALRKVVLRDGGKIVGWYIYYGKPGAVGGMVQMRGTPQSTREILDHLFHDGAGHQLIALHGVVGDRPVDDFAKNNCVFAFRGGWMVAHSRLDGEWCLGFGK